MAYVWTPDLAVGVTEIDEQHKTLFKAIDDFVEAMRRREGAQEMNRIVRFLQDYTKKHFGMEENLMDRNGYPEATNHKTQHKTFVTSLNSIADRLKSEGPSLGLILEAQRVVCDWLRAHVSNTDKKLGTYLQQSKAA